MNAYDTADRFTKAYIECALWSSTCDSGNPLDDNYGPDDISDETLAQMIEDCRSFQDEFREDLDACGLSFERQGHDLWLNRNGHGAGFWDECFNEELPEYAPLKRLSEASKRRGTFDLYVGDDGKVGGQ